MRGVWYWDEAYPVLKCREADEPEFGSDVVVDVPEELCEIWRQARSALASAEQSIARWIKATRPEVNL